MTLSVKIFQLLRPHSLFMWQEGMTGIHTHGKGKDGWMQAEFSKDAEISSFVTLNQKPYKNYFLNIMFSDPGMAHGT